MKVQGIYRLLDAEEMSCEDDDMLSEEDRRDGSLRDQTMVKWMLWDTRRGCERKETSTKGWM